MFEKAAGRTAVMRYETVSYTHLDVYKRQVQSIAFKEQPYIIESASVVGKKEGEGPLGAMFDVIEEENLFGEDTWEAAESTMQKEACTLALGKAHMKPEDIRFLYRCV